MRTIWKFPIPADGGTVQMPKGAEVLSVGLQGNDIQVWALVDPSKSTTPRHFHVRGTGHACSIAGEKFIGTIFDGSFVWHVFDGGELNPKTETT